MTAHWQASQSGSLSRQDLASCWCYGELFLRDAVVLFDVCGLWTPAEGVEFLVEPGSDFVEVAGVEFLQVGDVLGQSIGGGRTFEFFGVLKPFLEKHKLGEEDLESAAADTAIAIHGILEKHKKVHFWDDEALRVLAKNTKVADALISRPESLSALKKETLGFFTQCLHLDDAAETEDGEEDDATEQPLATGLHAKVYLLETRYHTHVIMGSANATNAALNASKNIEILVGLVGRKSKVGGIDELLGTDGLGEYLVDFDTTTEIETDAIRQEAEESVEQARSLISEATLSIECNLGSKDGLWDLVLIGKIPSLKGIVSACAWPITVMKDFAVDILENDDHGMIRLGEFSASSVTGLIAFELKSNHPDVTARFVLNLPVTGIPAERNSAILQTVISNQDGFIRYLMLLLGDDSASGLDPGNGSGFAKWLAQLAAGEDIPLLEELIRTYSRHPHRLEEISNWFETCLKAARIR